jgi:TRAP-type C4-dicarboxylate transport system permease small subunit
MEWLYIACIVISGSALVLITLIIPLGVFMRYVMNSPLSWPEPARSMMMVMFSFLGGARSTGRTCTSRRGAAERRSPA